MSEKIPDIGLHDMTEQTFEKWLVTLIKEYASEKVKAGNWAEAESLKKAHESIETLLSNGVHTENHFLYTIMDTSTHQEVGYLWLAIHIDRQNNGFIYDLKISESYRGQGYATAAMKALESKAKSFGMDKLSLHVFRHNEIARSLYSKLGYEMTSVLMAKDL